MINIKAIAVFTDDIRGTVKFTEEDKKIRIDVNIIGLKPNSFHGFHVHEAGDLTDKCLSMCSHFNPYGLTHGCPGMKGIESVSSDQEAGTVLGVRPEGGSTLPAGSGVILQVANGTIKVPNLIGQSAIQARATLTQAGF